LHQCTSEAKPRPAHLSLKTSASDCFYTNTAVVQHCMILQAAIRNVIRDAASSAAVISLSCDGAIESRSPTHLGISRYGDPPNNAHLLDRLAYLYKLFDKFSKCLHLILCVYKPSSKRTIKFELVSEGLPLTPPPAAVGCQSYATTILTDIFDLGFDVFTKDMAVK